MRSREVAGEKRPDHHIPRFSISIHPAALKSSLMRVAKFLGDGGARKVCRGTMDFDAGELLYLEGDAGERGRGFGCKAITNSLDANPVSNLGCFRPDSRMQPRAAEHCRLVEVEDAVCKVLHKIELSPKLAKEIDFLLERLRFSASPRHLREVIEARIDGRLQERRIPWLPAAQGQSLGDNSIGASTQHA